MKNIKYNYFLICGYILAILGLLYDVFKIGYSNIRIYQVIMIIFFSISLFYKIKEVIEKKNNTDIE